MNDYFEQISRDLKKHGVGIPQLILDKPILEQNLQLITLKLNHAQHIKPRLVVKSLACLGLLKLISTKLQTQRFMVFHLPQLVPVLEHFPQADILFGKPMPFNAFRNFYQRYSQYKNVKIQWLIDTIERLKQYLKYAQEHDLVLNINLEIDVGLHRGGVENQFDFMKLLTLIEENSEYLKLSGLMGYDAHITKLPSVIKKPEKAYEESQKIYLNYQKIIQEKFINLWREDLCFNGGGSPSFYFHMKHSVCNDLSFGSMLVKPSDFDSVYLQALQPALWIASPVIKELAYTRIPSMPLLDKLPHKYKALFVYGGYWMADYIYPKGSHPHVLYGRSSNQELVNVPKNFPINIDDFVFLRPTQSEAIIPQFSHLYVYENRGFEEWMTFRE